MRISDWSSDVCSSDLPILRARSRTFSGSLLVRIEMKMRLSIPSTTSIAIRVTSAIQVAGCMKRVARSSIDASLHLHSKVRAPDCIGERIRSEEHTSELQSLMRISYAVFCLKKKIHKHKNKYDRG